LAQDFALFGYPVANPERQSSCSPDFTADFWKCTSDPVIRFFEQELTENQLDGVIAVKANEPIAGFQIQVSSRVIATEVLCRHWSWFSGWSLWRANRSRFFRGCKATVTRYSASATRGPDLSR